MTERPEKRFRLGRRVREWAFQVHLWCGLAIGVWALIMGLSGGALVFKEEIEEMWAPEVFTVEAAGIGPGALERVAGRARARFPNHFLGGFYDLDRRGRAPYLWVGRESEDGELIDRWNLYFHPETGEVLGARKRYTGLFGFLENVHFFLLAGRPGFTANGFLGLALTTLCATGLWIWFPKRGDWRQALRVRWSSSWKRVVFDLHRAWGFFTVGWLALMALTGAHFAFFNEAVALGAWLSGGRPREARAAMAPPATPAKAPSEATKLMLDRLASDAERLLPAGCRLWAIVPPREPGGLYRLRGRRPGNPALAGRADVFVDSATGEVVKTHDSRDQPIGVQAVMAFSAIHFGQVGRARVEGAVVRAEPNAGGAVPNGILDVVEPRGGPNAAAGRRPSSASRRVTVVGRNGEKGSWSHESDSNERN